MEDTAAAVTPLQADMLDRIARSEYQPANGEPPRSFSETDEVWSQYIIKTAQDKGVATSLINAGLILCHQSPDGQNTTRLTEAGFAAWQAAFRAAQGGK